MSVSVIACLCIFHLLCVTGDEREKPPKRRRRKRRKPNAGETETDATSESASSAIISPHPLPLDEPLSIPAALLGNNFVTLLKTLRVISMKFLLIIFSTL